MRQAFPAGCLRRLTINGSRYLLVEFARSDPDAETLALFAELHSLGLIPFSRIRAVPAVSARR
jgi:tyrosine-protein phosphatase YwqE